MRENLVVVVGMFFKIRKFWLNFSKGGNIVRILCNELAHDCLILSI